MGVSRTGAVSVVPALCAGVVDEDVEAAVGRWSDDLLNGSFDGGWGADVQAQGCYVGEE